MLTPRIVSQIAPHALLSPPSWGNHPGDSSGRIAEGCDGGESGAGFHLGDGSQRDRNTEDRHKGGLDGRKVDRGGRVEGGEVSPSRREAQVENTNPVDEEDVVCVTKGHHGLQKLSETALEEATEEVPVEPPAEEELEKVVRDAAPLDSGLCEFGGLPGISFPLEH